MRDDGNELARKIRGAIECREFPQVDLGPHIAAMAVATLGHAAAQEMAHRMEVDRLTMELAVCVPAERHAAALAEVDRRRDLFISTWSESAVRSGARPDAAALKSVVDDVVNGRWLL